MIRLMEKFLFIASPVSFPEDETTIGAIGGEEQVYIITISDFFGYSHVPWTLHTYI